MHLRAMHRCVHPCLAHVLSRPCVIRYNRPAHKAAGHYNVRQNWRKEGRTVPVGVGEISH
jgi:hypothetical protein